MKVAYKNAYNQEDDPTEDFLLDDIMKRAIRPDVTQVALCQADSFFPVAGKHTVGWTMLEVTGLPPAWVAGCNSMDEVWVPASFNVDTFRNSGVTAPIHVMPLGVDVDYIHPEITGYRPSTRFTFLSVFEWGERKAPEVLLRAFAEEFKDSEDVLLLLAVTNRDPHVDVHQQISDLDLPPGAPVVVMLNPKFTAHQMGSCTARPTPSCSPPGARAGACRCSRPWPARCPPSPPGVGLSGPADSLHEGVGFPLEPLRLVPAEARCPYYEGFDWADPDVEQRPLTDAAWPTTPARRPRRAWPRRPRWLPGGPGTTSPARSRRSLFEIG